MAIKTKSRDRVVFGEYELDCRSGELRRNGTLLKLQPQPAKILAILAGRAGELVTRQELAEQVWGSETYVDFEHGLNFAVGQIRGVLEDDPEQPRFLETVPKRGYRFIATTANVAEPETVSEESAVDEGASSGGAVKSRGPQKMWTAATVFAILAVTALGVRYGVGKKDVPTSIPIHSIAVLPLVNLSADPAQEYFSDGLTDELITELAKIGNLRVISRTSVATYKHSDKKSPEIGTELHVDSIVEGTVERVQDRVRIRVQLIRTSTDEHLWAESYDRESKDVLQLESEVAHEIADRIGVVTSEQPRPPGREHTVSAEAHENYLRGRFYWNKRTEDGFRRAISYFEKAIGDDPNYAQAYAGLADCYVLLGYYSALSPTEAYPKAKVAARRALELDPSLGEAHTSLAGALQDYDWNWPEVEREHKLAVELSPGYATAHQWYGNYLDMMGRFQEAQVQIRRARDLDPLSLVINCNLAWSYFLARDDRALEEFMKMKEMDPNFYWIHLGLGRVYVQKKMYKSAILSLERAAELSGNNEMVLSELGHAYGMAGRRHDAQRILANLQKESQQRYVSAYDVGLVYVGLGQTAKALKWFEKAYRDRCRNLQFIGVEPRLDPLRTNVRFQSLTNRLNLPVQTVAAAR
ncbi:MAG: winged helix-turn-helix domain-containing protein [Acidobacteria bacterium]|nr:winged helix-turn-helix domain-containing protein [Acidobacteriota bacterium]